MLSKNSAAKLAVELQITVFRKTLHSIEFSSDTKNLLKWTVYPRKKMTVTVKAVAKYD